MQYFSSASTLDVKMMMGDVTMIGLRHQPMVSLAAADVTTQIVGISQRSIFKGYLFLLMINRRDVAYEEE